MSEVTPPTRSLRELETIIDRGIASFIETGNALAEIRARRLYREQGFATFEEYCQKRWKWTRRYVNYQIQSAEVVQNLGTVVPNAITERQARELTRLSPERQREVAATIDFQHTTAAKIRARVQAELRIVKTKPAAPEETEMSYKGVAENIENGVVRAAALPQPITRVQLRECLGSKAANAKNASQWDRPLKLLPWLTVRSLANEKVRLTIDEELREICQRRQRGGKLPMEFMRDFFKEFMRRRKEADLANSKRVWNPDAISKLDLIEVLTWVEDEVRSYISGKPANTRGKTARPSKSGARLNHDNEAKVRTTSTDAGTGATV